MAGEQNQQVSLFFPKWVKAHYNKKEKNYKNSTLPVLLFLYSIQYHEEQSITNSCRYWYRVNIDSNMRITIMTDTIMICVQL